MTQCKKEYIQNKLDIDGVYVTLTASRYDDTKTNIVQDGSDVIMTWNEGDKLYVFGATQGYLGSMTILNYSDANPSCQADFGGKLNTSIIGPQDIHFYYVGKNKSDADFIISGDNCTYNYDISSQDGTLDSIENTMHLMHGSVTDVASGTIDFGHVSLQNMIALAKFDISGYCMSAKCDGANSQSTLNLKTGQWGTFTKTQVSLVPASLSTSVHFYMVLLPGTQTLVFNNVTEDTPAVMTEHNILARKFYSDNGNHIIIKNSVNLGLPSPYENLEWATYNLGSTCGTTNESWYGNYYAWGETSPLNQVPSPYLGWTGSTNTYYQDLVTQGTPKTDYSWTYYKWGYGTAGYSEGDNSDLYKYTPTDGKTVLEPADDAATVMLGAPWRMPMEDEFQKLYDNCTYEWLAKDATSTNVSSFIAPAPGFLFIKGGKNSVPLDNTKYVFFPTGGSRKDGPNNIDTDGYYWTRSITNLATLTSAFYMRLKLTTGEVQPHNAYGYRIHGMSVRSVYDPDYAEIEGSIDTMSSDNASW